MKKIIFLLIFISIGLTAFSQTPTSLDKDEHLLNGTSFTFQYQTGGAMDISFTDDKLSYTWIAGRNAGQPK